MGMYIIFIWLVLSLLVGIAGSYRTIGFFGALLLSVFLSPVVGVIGVALSSRTVKKDRTIHHTYSSSDTREEIERKAKLYDERNR